jgi:nucleotide-binding universal stress UspA family protein
MLQTILLPLDGSPLADQALPFAAMLARQSGARIVLVRAAQPGTLLDVDLADAQVGVLSRAEHDLDGAAARLRDEGITCVPHVYYDAPVSAILEAARRHHADLIVMSTHGRSGLGRVVYGSVADDILRHADVPVLLIPPAIDHAWPADRALTILVPLDGSELAEAALRSAALLADLPGARLHLLRVIEPARYPLAGEGYVYVPIDDEAERADATAYLDDLAARMTRGGTQVTCELATGSPGTVIPRVAREREVDVIAMATHGRGGLARLVLGSVATATLQRTHGPLLLTRPSALGRPTMATQAAAADVSAAPTLTVTLTPSDVALICDALQVMLSSMGDGDESAAPLRALLGRLRAAEQPAPAAAPASREAVGTR